MDSPKNNVLTVLAGALAALALSTCMVFAAVPNAYADDIKPNSAILQMDNFNIPEGFYVPGSSITSIMQVDELKTPKGVDVSKEVATIDVSSGDTLFKLTVNDRYSSGVSAGAVKAVRTLMQVDEKGNASVVQTVNNSNVFSFRARGLEAGNKLVCKTQTDAECDATGKVVKRGSIRDRYKFELNATLVDPSDVEEPTWELGDEGFSYTLSGTGFKFVDGTTISLNALHLPVTYKHSSDGTTVVGIGCSADDAEFYSAVKNGNVWQKYTDPDITKKLQKIDKAWLKNKLGAWGSKGIDWSLFGYAEFNTKKPDEKWTVTLCGKVAFTVEGHAQYFIFTGDLDASVGGDLIASLTRYPKTKTLTGRLSIGVKGTLELYVGIGCQYIASVGVYGAGGIHAGLDLQPREDLGFNDVYVEGEVGAKAKAFGFPVATWKILEGRKDLYKRQRPSTLRAQDTSESDEPTNDIAHVDAGAVYPQVPRDYLDADFVWNGEPASTVKGSNEYPLAAQGAVTTMDEGASGGVTTADEGAYDFDHPVVANTYSETDVQTASNGKDAIMVFIADANDLDGAVNPRLNANRGVLVYSRYDKTEGKWSAPMPVQGSPDDERADYNPSVCIDKNGTAYVTWLNASTAITDTTKLGDVADILRVCVAKIEKGGAVTVKTVDGVSDSNIDDNIAPFEPRVCLVGEDEKPCVAWFTNQADSDNPDMAKSQVIGLSGTHGVYIAQPESGDFGGTWQVVGGEMSNGDGGATDGAVTSFALGDFGGNPICAWTFYPDFVKDAEAGIVDQLKNSNLFVMSSNGTQSVAALEAASAQFAKKDGSDVLTFYQGGAIKSLRSGWFVPTTELSADNPNAVPSANYIVTGDLASNAMISYAVAGDGATDIRAQVLKDGTWSEEGEVTSQGKPITYYSAFYLDGSNGSDPVPVFVYSCENTGSIDEPGDGSAALYSITGGPLRHVSVEDVVYDDSTCKPGDKLEVGVIVKNTGTMPVNGAVAGIALLKGGDFEVAESTEPLEPGETTTIPITITLPEQSAFDVEGEIGYMAAAYPADITSNDLARQNDNSTKEFSVGDANLIVDAHHLLSNGQESVTAVVANAGMATASGTLIFEDSATGARLASAKLPALKAHESFEYNYAAPKKLFDASGVDGITVRIEGATVQAGSIASETSVATWDPITSAANAAIPLDTEEGGVVGGKYVVGGNTYQVKSNTSNTVALVKAKKAKTVKVPATVTIDDKKYRVTTIGAKAFAAAKGKVQTVTIGKNVTGIAKNAFASCKKLKKVKGGSSVKTIGAQAFYGCKALTSCAPVSSKKLTGIGAKAFKGAKSFKTLTVKSKKLKKKSVKGSLTGSSVSTVKVKVGSKKANKTYVKRYKKIFTKKNCGKQVTVR